ncbi:60S ribosomal protein L23a [Galemys pyrenaicus]|uniref:60S ribosomal protein L23a n=1 Tax=Galemys pyrenaicus TaxID=202257 RepID=A0A8J6AHS9_GALPY|nr:60S ribosomal protein L23a [Galemys pyrenaicus]
MTTLPYQSPLTTESALKKREDKGPLVFLVGVKAHERQLTAAVKRLYDMDAAKANTLLRLDGEKKAEAPLTPGFDALDVINKIGIL